MPGNETGDARLVTPVNAGKGGQPLGMSCRARRFGLLRNAEGSVIGWTARSWRAARGRYGDFQLIGDENFFGEHTTITRQIGWNVSILSSRSVRSSAVPTVATVVMKRTVAPFGPRMVTGTKSPVPCSPLSALFTPG